MDKSNSFGQATQRILQLLVVFAVLLGFSPLSVGATLDSFTTSQPELTDTTSGDGSVSGSVGDGSDATMLGGARDISIDLLSGPTQAKMTLISSVGYISMSVDALSTARGVIQWDGPDGSINLNMTGLQTGDVGVDLSSGGAFDAFSITKIFADHDYEFVIGVYTNGSSWTEITYAAQATGTTVTDTYLFEHFSDASLCNTTNPLPGINAVSCGATPADTTNVGAVQLILDPEGKTLELDVVLDSIDLVTTQTCFASIGDIVWNDLNRNGIQDAGEPGIDGVVINLKNDAGVVIASTTTATVGSVSGKYEFKNLCAGVYTVEVDESTLPPDMVASPNNQGTDVTVDSNGSPELVSLPNDLDSDLTIDFGYNSPCTGRIGDYVWFDENRNGIQDAGESGISGVTVNLKDSSDAVIATATTNANGLYEFTGLCAGDYRVEVVVSTLPTDYVASPTLEGADDTVDSNDNNSLVSLFDDASEDVSIDFGYNSPCTGRIGDYVWFDENRNGIQDAGESGIAGVVVNLKDDRNIIIATATTNANGLYEFSGLCAGDYRVEVDISTLPANYVASPTLQGTDDTVDSNDNDSVVSLLDDMSEDVSIDFGYNSPCTGRIGDYVWFDENRNGIQDAGEAGISGVVVNLKDSSNTVIATATTNANGLYEFSGLCAGDYRVEVDVSTLPADYVASPTLEGTDDTIDSNENNSLVSLLDDMSDAVSIDFGYNSPCSGRIGDYVWFDENRNGIQDAGEAGISGVVVNLKDSSNTVIATATTNANGLYEFSGLCAGDYRVEVDVSTLPANYVASPTLQGMDGTVDSDENDTLVKLMGDMEENVSIDFGYNSPCSGRIGDYVWFDENRNGIQDAGEAGISGVVVNLKDSSNTVIATATTNANGLYEFSGLCAGDYRVEVDVSTLPADYVASPTLEGTDDTIDSNENNSLVSLLDDMSDAVSIDFGYNSPCSGRIGDYVWFDENRNGIQDAGEAGISGVVVNLKDSSNTVIATATTNANGLYEFSGLCAGDYRVEVDVSTLPADYVASPILQGTDDTVDSNDNNSLVSLFDDMSEDVSIDFGYNSPCTGRIGDYVWFDSNRNGIQDAGESGIAGVVINLKDSNNAVIATVTTNANGFYEFSGLCAGDYRVEADESTLPPGYVASPALAGEDPTVDSNINGSVITLDVDNDVDVTFDLGFNSPCAGSIGDYIWFDENRNGIQDAGEAGISGVVVNLKDSNNAVIATATTNADGLYEFSGLCAGDYKVEVDVSTLPDGYVASPTLQGGDDTADSNENGSMVTLADDMADNLSIDFGYNSPCTGHIGDYVWLDANDNGIQDAGEAGIPNVTLELKDSLNVVVATATTNSNGFYEFVGICAGEYTVEVDPGSLPDGVTPTESMVGTDDAVDSNGSPAGVILPNDFASDVTIDFGYIEKMIPDETCKVCDGKVTQLTLRYNGDQPAHVKVKQNKYKLGFGETVVFDSTVQPGESFTFSGVAKRGTLGTEITIYVDGVVNTSIHTSCSVPIGPGLIAGDFEVIEGYSRNGGLMCPIDYTPPPPPSNECSVCDGKATMLTLQYDGGHPARVVVKQKYGVVVFDSTVQPGESFTFSGVAKRGTLGTEIKVYVDGEINTRIHTSCSVPIGPGLVAGDFKVLEAYSLNGGLMCPIDPTTPPSDDDNCDKSYYDSDSDGYGSYDKDSDSSSDYYGSYDKDSDSDDYGSYDKDSDSDGGRDACDTHYDSDDSYGKDSDSDGSYDKSYGGYDSDSDGSYGDDSYSKDSDSDSSYESSYDKDSSSSDSSSYGSSSEGASSSYEKYDGSSDKDGWSSLLSWFEKYYSK